MRCLWVSLLLVVTTATGCMTQPCNPNDAHGVQDRTAAKPASPLWQTNRPQPAPVTADQITPANWQQMMDAFAREMDQEQVGH